MGGMFLFGIMIRSTLICVDKEHVLGQISNPNRIRYPIGMLYSTITKTLCFLQQVFLEKKLRRSTSSSSLDFRAQGFSFRLDPLPEWLEWLSLPGLSFALADRSDRPLAPSFACTSFTLEPLFSLGDAE